MIINLSLFEATKLWQLTGQPAGKHDNSGDNAEWYLPGFGTLVRAYRTQGIGVQAFIYTLETDEKTDEATLAMVLLSRPT